MSPESDLPDLSTAPGCAALHGTLGNDRQKRSRMPRSRHSPRAEIEAGRRLFAGDWQFVAAAGSLASLPPMRGVEIAFAGRSNVGKSSLINALTGRNALARTSRTPGRTQD